MSYVTSPYAPRARRQAVNLVRKEGWSQARAARYAGVHRSTVGRWVRRAQALHGNSLLYNASSRPHTSPRALDRRIVNQICILRRTIRRCAVVIWLHLRELGVTVSLSSVKRTLKRQGLVRLRSKWARYRPRIPRPQVERLGDLVQADTVHFVRPDGRRVYLYTVIDVCSRWAYAEYHERMKPELAVQVVLRAQTRAGFAFRLVQTDHGPEFSSHFRDRLQVAGVATRYTRLRRPNDNAHIERFNRTIQEEGFAGMRPRPATASAHLEAFLRYYNEQRLHLGIGGLTPARFVAKVLS